MRLICASDQRRRLRPIGTTGKSPGACKIVSIEVFSSTRDQNIAANWLRMELPDRFRSRAGIRDFTQQAAGQALMTRLRPASFER
jgi:hypothetical protein